MSPSHGSAARSALACMSRVGAPVTARRRGTGSGSRERRSACSIGSGHARRQSADASASSTETLERSSAVAFELEAASLDHEGVHGSRCGDGVGITDSYLVKGNDARGACRSKMLMRAALEWIDDTATSLQRPEADGDRRRPSRFRKGEPSSDQSAKCAAGAAHMSAHVRGPRAPPSMHRRSEALLERGTHHIAGERRACARSPGREPFWILRVFFMGV